MMIKYAILLAIVLALAVVFTWAFLPCAVPELVRCL
jgi:hypothetical protein